MCFHTTQTKLALEIETRFHAKFDNPADFSPAEVINGFSYAKTPVIIDDHPDVITHYNWGLIPAWAKDTDIRKMTLNARIETVDVKPSFRDSVNKRCLVIADGFFEWQWLDIKGKHKIKYEIGIENHELFAFAGIYSQWKDKKTGEVLNTYAILTTEANPLMAEIHNTKLRMPVILKKEDEAKWLEHAPIHDFEYPYQVNLVATNLDAAS